MCSQIKEMSLIKVFGITTNLITRLVRDFYFINEAMQVKTYDSFKLFKTFLPAYVKLSQKSKLSETLQDHRNVKKLY